MGLDASIKYPNGKPLGNIDFVQSALADVFSGIVFGRLTSGADKIKAAAEEGIVFPDIIRQLLESSPASYGGDYKGVDFSAQFGLGVADVVQQIDVVLYGETVASEPMFAKLEEKHGWITTHP